MPNGGTIIVGLDERAGFATVGVSEPAALEASIASQARNGISPPLQVAFEEAEVDGAVLVVATVNGLPSDQRPCRYGGKAYLRQADGDYVMSEQEVQQILALRQRPRHEAVAIDGTTLADLDDELLHNFLTTARSTSRRLSTQADEDVLRRKAVLAPDGKKLTLAGLYALGSYPQQFLPSLSITAAVQLDPRSGQRTRDLVHLDGPVPALLEGAMEWVQRNTRTAIRFGPDGHGHDEAEIPLVAVRELVANALVHRDLGVHTRSKRVELRLRDDQLIIGNPGGLYGVSREQLGTEGGKSAVNEFLYDICKLTRTSSGTRVIEGEGGGIREVQRALRSASMRPPTFIDKGVSFTVLVPRHALLATDDITWLGETKAAAPLSDVQRQIVTSMRHGQTWTNSLVRKEFAPIDSIQARSELRGLVTAGLAQTSGQRAQTTYSIRPEFLAAPPGSPVPHVIVRPPHIADEPDQDTLPIPELSGGPGSHVSRNAPVVWEALGHGPATLDQIMQRAGLSESQTRYALRTMMDAGFVSVRGGQGVKGTLYTRGQAITGT
ncbi:ATP-dependent DNA helicase RecG [Raineyella antarctica]|uniref:ATP-dependent DNA helicase RecG n=2 Tax=Raineyella antarctica TaxID=1577474 RepID=A0A1G6HMR9_9ACTN|nr:ATP-dependent DNA helicase RecG [Raineyella antarctica]